MTAVTWAAPAAAFCVLAAGTGVRLLAVPAFDAPVLVTAAPATRAGSALDRVLEWVGRPIAPALLRFAGERSRRSVAARLAAAGVPDGPDGPSVHRFMARRAGGGAVGLLVVLIYVVNGKAIVGVLIGALIAVHPGYRLRSAAKRRQEEIQRSLPDMLDVLTVTIMAGASFRLGLTRVAQALPGPLAEELFTTLRHMQVGETRRRAFELLRERNPAADLRRFVAGVLQAEELGSSLSGVLDDLAADMRKTAMQQARRRADSTDKTIALITTLLLLPAMILLVISVFLGGISAGR